MTHVYQNIISANYGGSQAFDTDDGSSWYDIHHNFWFDSDGFKMDYSGHNSTFHDNLVAVKPYDGQNCINGDENVPWQNNTCIIMGAQVLLLLPRGLAVPVLLSLSLLCCCS